MATFFTRFGQRCGVFKIAAFNGGSTEFNLRLCSHCSAYELFRFCRHLSTVHTALFLYKSPDKSIRFCGLTLLTATEEKISVSMVLIR